MSEKSRWTWIPVTERLPENDKPVWATAFDAIPKTQGVAWYRDGKWELGRAFDSKAEVVAWMPLNEVIPPEFEYDPIQCPHHDWKNCWSFRFDSEKCRNCQKGWKDAYILR